MDAVRKDIEELVQKELDSANSMFPLFRSPHEGYAVILEELEEAEQEIKNARMYLDSAWHNIKHNRQDAITDRIVGELKHSAIKTAIEAVQVAAMAQKYLDSVKGEYDCQIKET